jgi:hypothetical protein
MNKKKIIKAEWVKSKAMGESKVALDAVYKKAYEACSEAKELADEIYREANSQTDDEQIKEEAKEAHKEALIQADKLRDALISEANVVFGTSYDKAGKEYEDTIK